MTLTLATAQAVVDAVARAAADKGLASNIAVCDAGGHLLAFARMDGALLATNDVAIRKARTAALLQMDTATLGPLTAAGGPLASLELTNGGLITFGGGSPLKGADGTVVGGVGVSGSSIEDDTALVAVGVSAAG